MARDKEIGKPGKDHLLASDDPRRGGKIGYSYKYEEEGDQSNLAKQRITEDLRKRVSQSLGYEDSDEKWETDATIHKRSDASTITLPQTMWKDEVSSPAFRHIPKITNDNPCEKGGATRKKVMKSRIPWWPELLNKKRDHIGGILEDHHDEIHDDENDVFYDSVRDLEDLDSNHNGEETISVTKMMKIIFAV